MYDSCILIDFFWQIILQLVKKGLMVKFSDSSGPKNWLHRMHFLNPVEQAQSIIGISIQVVVVVVLN